MPKNMTDVGNNAGSRNVESHAEKAIARKVTIDSFKPPPGLAE